MGKHSVVLERCFVEEGKLVMREGDAGNCAYLIQSGSVSVYKGQGDNAKELAKLGPGEIFGEIALVFDEPRGASVKTLEHSNFIVITRMAFNDKLEKSDPTIRAIVKMLSGRIKTANNALVEQDI